MKRAFLACLLLFTIGATAPAQETCTCGGTDMGVAPAFKVHGRLKCWNGAPTLRISVLGTKRILGVHGDSPIPENLTKSKRTFWTEVVGDFLVCPLTKSKPGVMQIVCIISAENIKISERSSNPIHH
jgi:hypothetical protein